MATPYPKSEPDEIWIFIAHAPNYEISSWGRVRRGGRILKPKNMPNGYLMVGIYPQPCVLKTFYIHRLVGEFFIEGFAPGLVINHKDGNKLNNVPSNLEWVSQRENIHHSIKTLGNTSQGELNSRSKLTESDVKRIRALIYSGLSDAQVVVQVSKVGRGAVYKIRHQLTWSHL